MQAGKCGSGDPLYKPGVLFFFRTILKIKPSYRYHRGRSKKEPEKQIRQER